MFKVGTRVRWRTRAREGTGTIAVIDQRATGAWYVVDTKKDPRGYVVVRLAQLKRA